MPKVMTHHVELLNCVLWKIKCKDRDSCNMNLSWVKLHVYSVSAAACFEYPRVHCSLYVKNICVHFLRDSCYWSSRLILFPLSFIPVAFCRCSWWLQWCGRSNRPAGLHGGEKWVHKNTLCWHMTYLSVPAVENSHFSIF